MGLVGGDDEVVGFVVLEYQLYCFDVVAGEILVLMSFEVFQSELVLEFQFDLSGGMGDFVSYEMFVLMG